MANKKPSKTFKSRIWKMTKSDIFTSIAILSIVLNIFLLSAVFVLTNGGTLNQSMLSDLNNRYCSDASSLKTAKQDAAANGQTSKQALQKFEITCKSGNFAPYYNQALHSYQQSQNK